MFYFIIIYIIFIIIYIYYNILYYFVLLYCRVESTCDTVSYLLIGRSNLSSVGFFFKFNLNLSSEGYLFQLREFASVNLANWKFENPLRDLTTILTLCRLSTLSTLTVDYYSIYITNHAVDQSTFWWIKQPDADLSS